MPSPETSRIQRQLGQAVKAVRADRQITQEELSRRTTLHTTYISDVERGARNPSWATIAKIASGLGVEVAAIAAAYDQLADEHHDGGNPAPAQRP